MKINQNDFEQIKSGLLTTLASLNLKPTDVTNKRDMWNLLHLSRQQGHIDLIALYRDYNDDHIETAIRKIFE